MASATESESSDDAAILPNSDADLWALLPRKFRSDYGKDGGQLPDDGLVAFLFADERDLSSVMAEYIPTNRKLRTTAIRALVTLLSHAMPRAQRQNQRRGRTDPAWQKVALAKKPSAGAVDSAGALDTVSWLFKHSGALCQRSTWSMHAKKLADSKLGLTRAAIEKAELQRWREQLVEILLEPKTPLAQQAQLASNPSATIAASLGSMRASTLRKRIREWRKLRAFSMGLDGSPRPRHVGVVLDYLQERIAEP